ncbi:MAG: protein kinase domain-containing protein [Saprospiraceae bacterium]
MAKKNSIEQLIADEDKLEEALEKFHVFLKSCEALQFNLNLTRARLAGLKSQQDIDVIPNSDARRERNQIRATFQEALMKFREEDISTVFNLQGRAEFLASIEHRDHVIHEFLDQRLLPKRYYRDGTPSSKAKTPVKDEDKNKDESKVMEGNSSIIYRLLNIDTERHAIAMVIKTPELDDMFKEGIQRLTDLRHRNVIKLLDHEIKKFPYFIITEYVYGDTLPKVLEVTGRRPVPQVADWLYQLTDALDYLRHKRILHTNVRPSKIFIDDEWQIMLSPFDLLKTSPSKIDKTTQNPKLNNPYDRTFSRYRDVCQYGSPELLATDGEGVFDMPGICNSDLYSIGLIGYKMLTSRDLFAGDLVYDILQTRSRFVNDPVFRLECLKGLPPCELSELILELLQEDPAARRNKYPSLHKLLRRLHGLTRLDEHHASDIRKSYRRCLASNKEFIRDFYELYYKKDGAKTKDFSEISKRRQSAMLQMSVDVLLDFDTQKDYLYRLMHPDNPKHGGFEVADFEVFLDTLLETVALNDADFRRTEGLEAAWKNVRDRTVDFIREIRGGK